VDKKGGLSPWEDSPVGSPSQEISGRNNKTLRAFYAKYDRIIKL
jgi:hypothetical protein